MANTQWDQQRAQPEPKKKTFLEIAQKYSTSEGRDKLIETAGKIADYYEIPRPLFIGLISHESKWNPLAESPNSAAIGLGGEFLNNLDGVRYLGELNNGPDDPRWHPGRSMDAVARLLRDNYKQHGNWDDAILNVGWNTPEYLDKVKASVAELEKIPGQTSGIFGNIWSGIKESAGHSLGKLAAASDVMADVHGPAITEGQPVMGREETIARCTPAYSPPVTAAEQIARPLGQTIGSLPELAALYTLLAPLSAPIASTAPLTTSVLRNTLPMIAQTATEPSATLKDLGIVGGVGTGFSLAMPLPWYQRLPALGAISLGSRALFDSNPEPAPSHSRDWERRAQALWGP